MANARLTLSVQLAALGSLESLLGAGFNLRQGVAYLGASQPKHAQAWRQLGAALAGGAELATGLEQLHFDPTIVVQAQLAAAHGQLAAGLAQARQFLQLQQRHRSRLKQLLVYPSLLLGLLAALQVGVVWLVLPALGSRGQVPWALWATVGLVGVGAAVAGWLRWLSPPRRFAVLRHLPGIGPVVTMNYQVQFVSGAAQALASGQTLTQYCQRLATLPAGVLQATGATVTARLADGQPLQQALTLAVVYPPLRALLTLGQTEALVAKGVAMFASQLMAAIDAAAERLLAVVQPLLFLVIGGQIVAVYASVLQPLYSQFGGGTG